MSKRNPFRRMGISWSTMKIGKIKYTGTYDGAKANACRASRRYHPKKWKTYSDGDTVYVERVA